MPSLQNIAEAEELRLDRVATVDVEDVWRGASNAWFAASMTIEEFLEMELTKPDPNVGTRICIEKAFRGAIMALKVVESIERAAKQTLSGLLALHESMGALESWEDAWDAWKQLVEEFCFIEAKLESQEFEEVNARLKGVTISDTKAAEETWEDPAMVEEGREAANMTESKAGQGRDHGEDNAGSNETCKEVNETAVATAPMVTASNNSSATANTSSSSGLRRGFFSKNIVQLSAKDGFFTHTSRNIISIPIAALLGLFAGRGAALVALA
eukprot:gnl/MRDRNA2_/MRDRNA2_78898_c0_seq1.p1 gnl/MRDRNA2_/MRDRNA2_78898_c0~~gnl/MRDRNA2_/MRDRNA2_78898_c0_seq1.p1  ORF type:complete len:270 (+),score=61.23 gnl/MRDRNA2_/MRDRNA2_78898_c0_seq1:376-1185(+)